MRNRIIPSLFIIIVLSLTAFIVAYRQQKPSVLSAKAQIPTIRQSSVQNNVQFRDDFNTLDTNFWNIPDREALEGGIDGVHKGYFKKDNISVKDGFLVMKLIQQKGTVDFPVISYGSEIESKAVYGYGTYEWRMRMSTTSDDPTKSGQPISGQVSAGFNFINNSATEIDFEVEGQYPNQLEMTTWANPDTSHFPTADDRVYTFKKFSNLSTQFHTYKYIWESGRVRYYFDDTLVADHHEDVSTVPAHFMVNHWGTNSDVFGGKATLNIPRYLLVDWVSFTPSEK